MIVDTAQMPWWQRGDKVGERDNHGPLAPLLGFVYDIVIVLMVARAYGLMWVTDLENPCESNS